MLPLINSETLVKRIVRLSLEVDWKLGARLAGEAIPDDLQQQTVELANALKVPQWLKVELLEETRSRFAIPVLGQFIQDSNSFVRRRAAEALGNLNYSDAAPALIQALQDPDFFVCEKVAEALGNLNHSDAVPALIQALQDPDPSVLENVAEALGNIKNDRAAHILPDLLKLISQDSQAAFQVLTTIQANCKFYNYEIYQQAQAMREQEGQQTNQAARPNTINAEVVQIIENNFGKVIGREGETK